MNEADLPSINLDELRLVPDWLREDAPNPSKQYAGFDRPIETDYPDRRGARPGGPGRDRRDTRGSGMGSGDRRNDRGRSGPPPRGGAPQRRDERPPARQENYQPVEPAPLRVEFLPDDRCMASIIKQIRSTHMAYPLFSLARMFLQEPARHFLQLSLVPGTLPAGSALYQLGEDGPVTLDRTSLEAIAFESMKDRFYKEETVQKDPPKGNFTNVARDRLSGALLGPTNYHGYQPALRALYESRYSRRMSFEDYRRNIEVSNDPTLVERWKEEARTVTTISTITGEPPTVFPSNAETRVHFRQHHLESLLHKGMSFRLHGSVARRLPEPGIMQAIREAHEREVRYPAQFVQLLRQGLQNAGLHIFKHRKRIVYVAATRPTPFIPASGAVTENVSLILATISESPLCTRKFLAERVLNKKLQGSRPQRVAAAPGEQAVNTSETATSSETAALSEETVQQTAASEAVTVLPEIAAHPADIEQGIDTAQPTQSPPVPQTVPSEVMPPRVEDELSRAKTALAADLRFLVQAGHIIEFHNATFDLPLLPKPKEESVKNNSTARVTPADDIMSIGADPASARETDAILDGPPVAADTIEEAAIVPKTASFERGTVLEKLPTPPAGNAETSLVAPPEEIDASAADESEEDVVPQPESSEDRLPEEHA